MQSVESSEVKMTLTDGVSINFNWTEFKNGLAESAANLILKGWLDAGSSAIVSAAKTIASISIDEPVEARAWRLIALSFALSLDNLRGALDIDAGELRKSLKRALVEYSPSSAGEGVNFISSSFVRYPSSSSLYKRLREVVVSNRAAIGFLRNISDESLRAKIDIAFNRSVFEVCAKEKNNFQIVKDYFSLIGAEALEIDLNWSSYRSHLQYNFEIAPTFGQEDSGISIAQLYVPLRAYWIESSGDERGVSRYEDGVPKRARVVNLDDALDKWAESDVYGDWLRLLGGGPGSGKSTTLKAFASRIAAVPSLRPLFIPLQHIGMAADLRAAINKYFVDRSGCSFTKEPLARSSVEDGPKLVLVFDGLDELVAPNENAKETISVFAHKLNNLYNELRGDLGRGVKIVVSGRMPAFQTAKQFLTVSDEGCLEVYGYSPAPNDKREDGAGLWSVDQRVEWWSKYSAATGRSGELPKAFSAPELRSITHEPLLAYLLVLADFATDDWKSAAENGNRIYARLMSDIYKRGWGDGHAKRVMKSGDFHKLMQTIGLAAWLGGDARVASEELFLRTVGITRAQSAWANFNVDKGPDVTNLAMNFYLKAAEGSQRGFEFTHKSFGEYLAALAILEVAVEIRNLPSVRMQFAMSEWSDATAGGVLTEEVLTFLRQEVALRLEEGGEQERDLFLEVKRSFETIAEAAASGGFPVDGSKAWRHVERGQLNAELAAWGVINSIARAFIGSNQRELARVNVSSLEGFGLVELIRRHRVLLGGAIPVGSCLTAVAVDQIYIIGAFSTILDLSYCKVNHLFVDSLVASRLLMKSANIDHVNLNNCRFGLLEVMDADLGKTSMFDTMIYEVRVDGAKFEVVRLNELTLASSIEILDSFRKFNVRLEGGLSRESMMLRAERISNFVDDVSNLDR